MTPTTVQPTPINRCPDATTPRRIAIVLLPSFSNFGLAAVIEPLAIANWLSQRTLFEWTLLSLDGQPVQASNGLMSVAQASLSAEQAFDVCVVIASFDVHKHSANASLKSWLRKQALFGAVLMGVETGTELLAAAGVLDGFEAAALGQFAGLSRELPPSQSPSAAVHPGAATPDVRGSHLDAGHAGELDEAERRQ
ncbi:AraC family transcriptional regulator [Pseudomonas sp. NPDC088368]|uniref:AraC family transcriptional regulator n=1 Tax=Pseudomonas sp. NPDC088368 TaxID=3364453 RepID=UPI0037FCD59B